MLSGIIALLVALSGVASVLLEAYMKAAPERKREKEDAAINELRTAIAAGDVVTVNSALDLIMRHSSPADLRAVQDIEAGKVPASPQPGVADLGEQFDAALGKA